MGVGQPFAAPPETVTRAAGTPPAPVVDGWAFARALSPRRTVRVADVDSATGRARNAYGSELPLRGPFPGRPYAVYLTDRGGRFRLLGFDLDAGKGPVAADLARLCALLDRARLAYVVCVSGPSGGRHVWVALAQPAAAEVVARLARALARMLPSLDTAPLTNPRTGALRPPGAPHRDAGTSRVLAGHAEALLAPTATPAQLLTLVGLVEQAAPPPEVTAVTRALGRDADGRAHLLGERRPLPRAARNALHAALREDADASAVLATVLAGAARARWRFEDVAALLETAPGLEHARSERAGAGRIRRSRDSALRMLLRQWEHACAFLATAAPPQTSTAGRIDEPDWRERITTVVDRVAAVQARADACPGRWARSGGPSDARVLDELCAQALAAVRPAVELDIRRLGLSCGISRETARVALHRLAAEGWITQLAPAAGVRAASWALPDPSAVPSTAKVAQGLSQAVPPRLRTWSDLLAWRSHLTARRATTAHDIFTPAGLGHDAARAYQMIINGPIMITNEPGSIAGQPTSSRQLADALGYPLARTLQLLDRLADAGLIRCDAYGRWRSGHTTLDRAAERLGVAGILDQRAARYRLEREAWAWWRDELAWRALPRAAKRRRRDPEPGRLVFELREVPGLTTRRRRGAHPTRPGGRADFAAALAILRREADATARAAA